MQERIKDTIRYTVKICFFISSIIFTIIYKFPFFLGVVYGLGILSYAFLFPSSSMVWAFDKIFNYSKSQTVVMKNEAEKNTKSDNRVKFKEN